MKENRKTREKILKHQQLVLFLRKDKLIARLTKEKERTIIKL